MIPLPNLSAVQAEGQFTYESLRTLAKLSFGRNDVFRGSDNPLHSTGLVPDPGPTPGPNRVLKEDATWDFVTAAGIGAVALQAATPGVVQVGNANISGTMIATTFVGALTGNASSASAVAVTDTISATCWIAMYESATGTLAAHTDGGLTYNATTAALSATTFVGALSGNASTATLAATVTVVDSTSATCWVAIFDAATGSLAIKTDAGLTYNATTAALSATTFIGALTGNASTATLAATVTVADTASATCWVGLFEAATGSLAAKTDGALTYAATTGLLTANVVYSQASALGMLASSGLTTVQLALDGLDNIMYRSASPHGLEMTSYKTPVESTISYVAGTRTFTIAPKAPNTTFNVYYWGKRYTKTSTSVVHAATEGTWFFYFDSAGTLTASQTPWDVRLACPVATIYWDASGATNIMFGEERHASTMDSSTHHYLHETVGTRYRLGLTFGDYTLSSNGVIYGSLTDGEIHDEDIEISITHAAAPGTNQFEQVLRTGNKALIPIFWRTGASGDWVKIAANASGYLADGPGANNRHFYNQFTGGAWQETQVGSGSMSAMWMFATNNISEPIILIMGQRTDGTLANARLNNTYESLSFGSMPFQEFKVLYRLIFSATGAAAWPSAVQLMDVQDLRSVSNLPSGTYVATSHAILTNLDYASAGHTGFVELQSTTPGTVQTTGNINVDGTIIAGLFSGPLTGNVTGNVSGSSGSCTGNSATATLAATVTVVDSVSATCWVAIFDSATGSLAVKTDAGLTYDATTAALSATTFIGNLTGNASGSSGSCTGNAASATYASAVTIVDDVATNATMYPTWVTANTGNLPLYVSSTKLSFNPSTGILSSTALNVGAGKFTVDANGVPTTINNVAYTSWPAANAAGVLTNDGFGAITWTAPAAAGTIAVTDTVSATCWVALFEAATGTLAIHTDGGLTYNATTAALSATTFVGALTGNASTATLASTVSVLDTADSTCWVGLFESATGSLACKTDGGLLYDASAGRLGIGAVPAYQLDITTAGSITSMRFGPAGDSAGFLTSVTAGQANLCGGAAYNGANWIAKNATTSQVNMDAGVFQVCTDSGKVVGNAFTPTVRFYIDAAGRAAFGNTTPDAAALVKVYNATATEIKTIWTTTSSYATHSFYENTTWVGSLQAIGSAYGTVARRNSVEVVAAINNAGFIAFRTVVAATEANRAVITNAGYLGVGTAAASAVASLLHLSTDTTAIGVATLQQASADADSFDIILKKSRGTVASPTIMTTADELGTIQWSGCTAAGTFVTSAAIKAISSGTVAATRMPSFMSFWTSTDAAPSVMTERMRIDNAGQVGIGTPAPDVHLGALLDVAVSATFGGISTTAWSATASQAPIITMKHSKSATIGTHSVVASGDALGYVLFRGSDGSAFRDAAYIAGFVDGAPGANDMPGRIAFYTTPDASTTSVERMRITNAGRVGIGTAATVPGALFVVSLNAATLQAPPSGTVMTVGGVDAATTSRLLIDAYGGSPVLTYRTALNTAAAPSALTTDTSLGSFQWLGYKATAYSQSRASINVKAAEDWDDSKNGTYMAFSTTPLATVTQTEWMRLDSTGFLGIGTTAPGVLLQVGAIADATANTIRIANAGASTVPELISYSASGSREWVAGAAGGAGVWLVGLNPASYSNADVLTSAKLAVDGSGYVGIGTTAQTFPLSFGASVGDKIALYETGAGVGYGLGVQSNVLQIYGPTSSQRVGIGYGSSASFTEMMSITNTGYTVQGDASGSSFGVQVATELLTVAAGATSTTAGNLIPLGAIVLACTCRVTTVIPTATSFKLSANTDATIYTGAVLVAAGSTDPGTTHWNTIGTTGHATTVMVSSAAQKVKLAITGSNPANNSGRVRITVYYWLPTPPAS